MVNKARETVFSTIESRTGAKLRQNLVKEIVNTPATWKTKFNLDKGAILGLSHSFFNVLSFRPSTRHSRIGQLYFVGASTHPGTGVPICLAGSKVTTEQILDDFKMAKPWLSQLQSKVEVKEIDKIQHLPLLSNFHAVIIALAFILAFVLYKFGDWQENLIDIQDMASRYI